MKRILVIEDGAVPPGVCDDARRVAGQLRRQNLDVQVLELESHPAPAATSPPTLDDHVKIFWPNRFSWPAWQEIRGQIRKFQPDEIHVWGIRAGRHASVLSALVRCPVKQVVASTAQLTRGPRKWWMNRVSKIFRHERLFNQLNEHGQTERSAGILPWFGPSSPMSADCPEQVRRQLGIPGDAKLVGTVAPLIPNTRIKEFVWAGDLLRCVREDVHWLVIGDGAQRWRLKRYASQLELEGRLTFIENPQNLMELISALDIYVQPSDWFDDYFGLRAAISYGVPAIGISQSIHSELIRHHRTGFLVERGARNEIARCVNRLVSEPKIIQTMTDTIRTQQPGLVTIDRAVDQLLGHSDAGRVLRAG